MERISTEDLPNAHEACSKCEKINNQLDIIAKMLTNLVKLVEDFKR